MKKQTPEQIKVDDKYFKRIIPIAKMEIDEKYLIEPKVEIEQIEKEVQHEEGIESGDPDLEASY